MSLDQLQARLQALLASGHRRIIGIAGAPGAGKSTLAQELASRLPGRAVVVPMDGFHLANVELMRLGLRHRKGAPSTFDSAGYASLLDRVRHQAPAETVYAPEFSRELDEAVAGAIPIFSTTQLVITEGNYLLSSQGPWARISSMLDERWYLDLNAEERQSRLVARHIYFGRDESAARTWVAESDEPNAVLIESTRLHADIAFTVSHLDV